MSIYQSPPDSGSNDGALPQNYDPAWQGFTNLTPSQVFAFQSFPQDLLKYAKNRRWLAEISGVAIGGTLVNTMLQDQQYISALKQDFDSGALTTTQFFDADGNVRTLQAPGITILYNAVRRFVNSLRQAASDLVTGIRANPATITTRKQIDAVYAAIAPNSPSATQPSPN